MQRQQLVFKAIWEEMQGARRRGALVRLVGGRPPRQVYTPRSVSLALCVRPLPALRTGAVHAVDTMVLKAPSEL